MKRNQAPVAEEELVEEARIVENRLENLFSVAAIGRHICVASKGYWLPARQHVRLESAPRSAIASHLLCYSSELKYHYLEPLQALYCLEASQLLVFHQGLPLSLAEAYELLISDGQQLTDYLVLQQLTRAGLICLQPVEAAAPDGQRLISFEVYRKETFGSRKPRRKFGGGGGAGSKLAGDRKRLTAASRGDGSPDYLIVSVRLTLAGGQRQQVPSIKQLLYLDELSSKRCGAADEVADEAVDEAADGAAVQAASGARRPESKPSDSATKATKAEIIFALVDEDYSVCFTRCAPMAMTFN